MNNSAAPISQIKVLPDHLINQIAAGEVVERPASVVKELLDNSLDAGAAFISIDIEQGGVGLIRIKDDGVGIPHDDLSLALTRHATSKISQMDDLRQLRTMGFRGEALPSIASISRLLMTSKFINAEHAWSLKSDGRMEQSLPEPASHSQGTSIEVRDLFFNVPARRKYLRAERTEFYQIQQLVRHFAISHPELGIRLSHNGRQILNLKSAAGNQAERIKAINGTRFMQNAIEIDSQSQNLVLTGWAGKAGAARTMNDSQFFCLNGRCIKDKRINHAIQQAYQGMLPEGRYATYALYLEIDPALVDVNVHPAKTEVRFRDGRSVHDFIYSALNRELRESQVEISEFTTPVKFNNATVSQPRPSTTSATQRTVQIPIIQTPMIERAVTPRPNVIHESSNLYQAQARPIKSSQQRVESEAIEFNKIGNVLLVKKNGELLLIDTNKLMLEFCLTSLKSELNKGAVQSKALLFPHNIGADELSATLYKKHSDLLLELGIDIVESSSQGWQLRQLPAVYTTNTNRLDEFITNLNDVLRQNESELKTKLLDMMSIYYAKNTVMFEQKQLLIHLDGLDRTGIVQKLSEDDLLRIIQGTFTSKDL